MHYGLLFQRLRFSLLKNALGVLLERSLARVLTIFFCSALIWCTIFFLSWQGFFELKTRWGLLLDGKLIALLFHLMFVALTVLLLFSTGIILYASLFGAPESAFLLSSPIPADHVFRYKLQGAVAFSSWAFVLLGSPILIAYGLEIDVYQMGPQGPEILRAGAPWYFFLAIPLFFLGFVLLPGCLGAIVVLALVNFLPNRRRQAIWVLGTLLLLALVVAGYWLLSGASLFRVGSRAWFDNVLGELSAMGSGLAPIHWMSQGMIAAARAEPGDAAYYLLLIWANGLLLWLATLWVARLGYRRGYNRVATGGDLRRRYGGAWMDRTLGRILFFLDPQTRILLVKDFRTFRRDPAQWFQIFIFLGLVTLYFTRMRFFYESAEIPQAFQNGISLLTLLATAFLTCAYTGRFIYPMLSLEGRKFWILGLLPLDRDRLMWGKFAFSATWCILTSEFVVILSNLMLRVPWMLTLVHVATAAMLALGLSGLSVGLGACMPNFRETDPSKIAVGFGGTLNLVAGLLFLVGVVALLAGPFHLALAMDPGRLDYPWTVPWWAWASAALGVVLAWAGTYVPMRAGMRNMRRMEF